MTRKSWLNLVLLAVVTALALFAYYKPPKGEPLHKLSVIKSADAVGIRIEIAGSPPVALARIAADWKLTAPLAARADNTQVQRLLEILEATSKDRYPATGLARYDLNEPYARVAINQQTFSFGAINELSHEQYVLTQDGIYPVLLRYAGALPKNALQLISKQLFAADEAPVAFGFADFTLAQQDGRWQLTPPATDVGADEINRWVDEWRLASAINVVPADQRTALSTIRIKLKAGADISVAVLQREPLLVLMRSDQSYAYELSADAAKRLLARPAASAK